MKVQLKTLAAGPNYNGRPGDVISVSSEDGKALVAGGYAAAVGILSPKPKQIETATAEPVVEKAVKPKPVRRKRAKK